MQKAFLADFKPESIRNRRKVFSRDTEVQDLRATLLESSKSAVVPVQTGGGGVGKTTLCKHYAMVHKADYDHIEFLRASSETELVTDLAALAKRFDATLDDAEGTHLLALRGRDLIEARAAKQHWLVVFDNVETPELMLNWTVHARHLHVLVTSRFPDWQAEGFVAKPLGVLTPDAAIDVLKTESGRMMTVLPRLPMTLGVYRWRWYRRANGCAPILQSPLAPTSLRSTICGGGWIFWD